jgi:hypothetical protein
MINRVDFKKFKELINKVIFEVKGRKSGKSYESRSNPLASPRLSHPPERIPKP